MKYNTRHVEMCVQYEETNHWILLQVDDQMKLLQDSWSEMLILDHIHHRYWISANIFES